jgi:signal transduction histidine kinase
MDQPLNTDRRAVHELKEPLHLISMQAEILLRSPDINPEDQRRMLFEIIEAASEASSRIDQLLKSG